MREQGYCLYCYTLTLQSVRYQKHGMTYGVGKYRVATHTSFFVVCGRCNQPLSKMDRGQVEQARAAGHLGLRFTADHAARWPMKFSGHGTLDRLMDQLVLENSVLDLGKFQTGDVRIFVEEDGTAIAVAPAVEFREDATEQQVDDFIEHRNTIALEGINWVKASGHAMVVLDFPLAGLTAEGLLATLNRLTTESNRANG